MSGYSRDDPKPLAGCAALTLAFKGVVALFLVAQRTRGGEHVRAALCV
jgi:hypothetical protein